MKTRYLVIIGIVLLAAIYVFANFLQTPAPIKFGDDTSPVMYFEREDCHWCIEQRPIMNELADEGFRVKIMDVGKNPEYWQQYGIKGTPALIDSKTNEKREGFVGAIYDNLNNYDKQKSAANEKTLLREWLTAHGAKIK